MKKTVLLLARSLSSLSLADAATPNTAGDVKTPGPPAYQDVKDSDKAMDRAVAKARESLSGCLKREEARHGHVRGEEKRFIEGDKATHIWVAAIILGWKGIFTDASRNHIG